MQRVVQQNHIRVRRLWNDQRDIHLNAKICSTLRSAPASRIIDKDLPHQVRRDSQKMDTVFRAERLLIDQPQIGFIDQRSTLQGVIWPLASQVIARDSAQLFIDERNEPFKRILIST